MTEATAKYWASEVQHKVIDACVQLFGGYGYMREYPVARAWQCGSNRTLLDIPNGVR